MEQEKKVHATLGASKASRWMACPGSVRLERGVSAPPESDFAAEGTCAHFVAELCLTGKTTTPWDYVGKEFHGVEVTEDMAEHVAVFVDYCRSLPYTQRWIEREFNLSALNPPEPMFGTADFVRYDAASSTLEVVDLKYGRGVIVDAMENKQLMYYGLGVLLDLGVSVDKVKLTIVQPRAEHGDGYIRSDEQDVLDIVGFAGELLQMAAETQRPDAKLAVGTHCRWCNAAGLCPEKAQQAQNVAMTEFSVMPEVTPPDPALLSDEAFNDVLSKIHLLEGFARAVWAHAEAKLHRGEPVPGWKLVQKRANRKWVDDTTVLNYFLQHPSGFTADDVCKPPTLKSPAQMEKVQGIGKNGIPDELITKESSGLTVVPVSDKRPAFTPTAADDEFDALMGGSPT